MESAEKSSDERKAWLYLSLVFVLGALAMYRPVWSMDFWLHLAAGRWMLDEGRVLVADPFSFTVLGTDWIDHEWLAQLFFALLDRVTGIEGLKLAAAMLMGCAGVFFFKGFASRGLSKQAALAACLLLLYFFESRFRLRPHLLTCLGAALLFQAPALPWSLARCSVMGAFYVLWLNSHGGWILVPLHFASLCLFSIWTRAAWRPAAMVLLVVLLLSLANPRGYLLPVSAWRISEVTSLIDEWKPIFQLGPEANIKAALSLAMAALALFAVLHTIIRRRSAEDEDRHGKSGSEAARRLAVLPWSQLLGLSSQRFLYLQAFACQELGRLHFARRLGASTGLAFCALLFLLGQAERWASLLAMPGGPTAELVANRFPLDCADELAKSSKPSRILCQPMWSGYLLARLGKGTQIAIDGRVELFGRAMAQTILACLEGDPRQDWPAWLAVDYVLLPLGATRHPHVEEEYQEVYRGRVAVLLARK